MLDEFALSPLERYQKAVLPVLRLAHAVVVQLGASDRQAVAQAAGFLAAHRDWAISVLRDRLPAVTVAALEQLRVLTGVIAMLVSAGPEANGDAEDDAGLVLLFFGHALYRADQ